MASLGVSSRYTQLLRDSKVTGISCYVCLQMVQRKPHWRQEGTTRRCILCNNDYCEKHKSLQQPETCEINHEAYCGKERHKARHAPVPFFRNIAERNTWVAPREVGSVVVTEEEKQKQQQQQQQ